MIQIRPITDLRNKLPEIEQTIKSGQPIYLTKNGYGSMVVMSLETYSELIEENEEEDIRYISEKLAEADREAAETDVRLTHEEVFGKLKKELRKDADL